MLHAYKFIRHRIPNIVKYVCDYYMYHVYYITYCYYIHTNIMICIYTHMAIYTIHVPTQAHMHISLSMYIYIYIYTYVHAQIDNMYGAYIVQTDGHFRRLRVWSSVNLRVGSASPHFYRVYIHNLASELCDLACRLVVRPVSLPRSVNCWLFP